LRGGRLWGAGLGRRALVFGFEHSGLSGKGLGCAQTQIFNCGSLRSFLLILNWLPKFRQVQLVKNFTNSLDCHAEPYLNRGQFLEQPYGSPLSSPSIHELIYPTHGEYFSKVEQLAPN
jgi:hypothetical protein